MAKSNKKRKACNYTYTMEEAEIECILDERGGNGKQKTKQQHEYLCAWADGNEEPQWVAAKHLKGTIALEEWEDQEDEEPEIFDPPAILAPKCYSLAQLVQTAKRTSILLGAGISAPILPTFRGQHGLWTKNAHKNTKADAKVSDGLQPTLAHEGLVALEKAGFIHYVATQNYDDLSSRSGFPEHKLSELHGNIFVETCDDCHKVFHRDFEVPKDDSLEHETGRHCEDCGGILRDSIIHFEEDLPEPSLTKAMNKFAESDLIIVVGSSLKVEPAAGLPFSNKHTTTTTRQSSKRDVNTCIVNLQPTGYDSQADLIIHGTCDQVIDAVAKELLGNNWR
ncbi:unnamed protein product [Cylindrotheca closterium]|uniref:protein acetyllysine N-acetyltransferase n=1 Tax=Cylindrotheca closterium TaxID=2856 RepID=A0AAD2JHW4_9STRA|nr:unnamed protein product [Cylindrotheca closterium]